MRFIDSWPLPPGEILMVVGLTVAVVVIWGFVLFYPRRKEAS